MKEAIQRKENKNKQNDPLQRRAEEAVQMKEMSPPPFSLDAAPAQMKGEEEEESSVQMKSTAPTQMKGEEEEEATQLKSAAPAQMKSEEEEEKA